MSLSNSFKTKHFDYQLIPDKYSFIVSRNGEAVGILSVNDVRGNGPTELSFKQANLPQTTSPFIFQVSQKVDIEFALLIPMPDKEAEQQRVEKKRQAVYIGRAEQFEHHYINMLKAHAQLAKELKISPKAIVNQNGANPTHIETNNGDIIIS